MDWENDLENWLSPFLDRLPECRSAALDAVVRAGSARSRGAQERRGNGRRVAPGLRATAAKLSVVGALGMLRRWKSFWLKKPTVWLVDRTPFW